MNPGKTPVAFANTLFILCIPSLIFLKPVRRGSVRSVGPEHNLAILPLGRLRSPEWGLQSPRWIEEQARVDR